MSSQWAIKIGSSRHPELGIRSYPKLSSLNISGSCLQMQENWVGDQYEDCCCLCSDMSVELFFFFFWSSKFLVDLISIHHLWSWTMVSSVKLCGGSPLEIKWEAGHPGRVGAAAPPNREEPVEVSWHLVRRCPRHIPLDGTQRKTQDLQGGLCFKSWQVAGEREVWGWMDGWSIKRDHTVSPLEFHCLWLSHPPLPEWPKSRKCLLTEHGWVMSNTFNLETITAISPSLLLRPYCEGSCQAQPDYFASPDNPILQQTKQKQN